MHYSFRSSITKDTLLCGNNIVSLQYIVMTSDNTMDTSIFKLRLEICRRRYPSQDLGC